MRRGNGVMMIVILSLLAIVMPSRVFRSEEASSDMDSGAGAVDSSVAARGFISARADLSQGVVPGRGVTLINARLRLEAPHFTIDAEGARPPIDLVVLLDLSSLPPFERDRSVRAAVDGVSRLPRAGDRFAILAVGRRIELVRGLADPDSESGFPTEGKSAIREEPSESTGPAIDVLDALAYAGRMLADSSTGRRRQVFLFTGGEDRSASPADELVRLGGKFGAEGIAVSAFGLGHEYDVDRLIRLASVSGGGYAHVSADSGSEGIGKALRDEWQRVVNRTLENVSIAVDLSPGVRFIRAYKCEARVLARRVEILSPTLGHGEMRSILLDLEVNGSELPRAGRRSVPLATWRVSYAPANSGSVEEKLELRLGARVVYDGESVDSGRHPLVAAEVESLGADLEWATAAARLRFGVAAYDGVAASLRERAEYLKKRNETLRSAALEEKDAALRSAAQRIENRSFIFGSALGEATFGQDKAAQAAGEYP